MNRCAVVTMCIGCLCLVSLPQAGTSFITVPSEPPDYEQLVRDLGSSDATVRKTAVEKLQVAAAVPVFVQAIGGLDENVARGAAEGLTSLLDADSSDVAVLAKAAVAELQQSPNERVSEMVKSALDRRQSLALDELQTLGARVGSRGRDSVMVYVDEKWQGGVARLVLLHRIHKPFVLHVSMPSGPITVADLKALHGVQYLQTLSLSLIAMEDDLSQLAALPNLKTLSIKFADGATGHALERVGKLGDLEQLGLSDAPDLDKFLHHVIALPHLRSLGIVYSSRARKGGLHHLTGLTHLETLSLGNVPDLDASLPEVAALPTLKRLTLRGRKITDSTIAYVAKATNLEELRLVGTAVTDDGLVHLRGLSQLRRLHLDQATVTDDAIPHLQELRGLQWLSAEGTLLSSTGIQKLQRELPNLQLQGVWHDPPLSVEHRQAIREIMRLGGQVSKDHFSCREYPNASALTAVTLSNLWCGDEESVQLLTKLDDITALSIETPLASSVGDVLVKLAGLRHISLKNTGMTDEDLRFLTKLSQLRSVTLSGPFTDAAVPILSQTTADAVRVEQTLISDAGRQSLANALLPNRQRRQDERQSAEVDRARSLAAVACAAAPADPALRPQARRDRNGAREQLAGFGVRAVPILHEMAQVADSGIRIQALLVLSQFGNRYGGLMRVPVDQREELFQKVQRAFQDLRSADQQQTGLVRSEEELSLIELGAFGGSLMSNPYEEGEYVVFIQIGWTGGDEGLACLKQLQPLTGLRLACDGVSRRGLAILKELPDISSLSIWMEHLEAEDLDSLHGLTDLTSLRIERPISDDALSRLVRSKGITSLGLAGISDEGLRHVAQLRQLTNLSISGAPEFSGSGLNHLTELTALRILSISSTGALGESLLHLARFPALEELRLHEVPLKDAGIRHIGEASQLRRLTIIVSTLVDDDLKHLSNLGQLDRLDLSYNGISDEGVVHLAELPSLQDVRLQGTFVSHEAIFKLLATLPGQQDRAEILRRMGVGHIGGDERPVVSPDQLDTARELIILGAGVWRGEAGYNVCLFPHWSGGDEKLTLLECLDNVRSLIIKASLTDAAIPYLKKLTHLEVIRLDDTCISDAGMQELKQALPDAEVIRPKVLPTLL